MINFTLAEESLGYVTAKDEGNSDFRLLVAGSKNVQIDQQKKVKQRAGYSRLGVGNSATTKVRNAWTWNTSTGTKLPMRFYGTQIEVYLEDVDGDTIDAWKQVYTLAATTELLRSCINKGGNGGWWDTGESIDLCLMVIGDDIIYEWSGAVAVASSTTVNTITKKATDTWATNRFYTNANRSLYNPRTGNSHTYTGGETTTTLTGVNNTTGIIAGDLLFQSIALNSGEPAANRTNHYIYNFENQVIIGSNDDNLILGSKNTDITVWSPSSPRLAGEAFTLTLDNPTRGLASLGSSLLIGSGKSSIFTVVFEQVAITTTLAESARIKKLNVGVNEGFLNQECIVPVGNTLFFLTNETTLRMIEDPNNLVGINPKRLSNPIKPDFDAEDWTGAFGMWYKNTLRFTAPANSRMYELNFVEDEDGKLFRFWNPPQTLPVGAMVLIDIDGTEALYGHSAFVPETYLLFDGASDGVYTDIPVADKIPIEARATFAYNNYKKKGHLKNFDEYYVEGDITQSTTELDMILRYDFDGITQEITKTIDGSDEEILEGEVGYNSLAQQSLAVNPLGSLLIPPTGTRKYRLIFEIAREDFHELQTEFYSNDVDKFWSVISHGANAKQSRRKPINLKI